MLKAKCEKCGHRFFWLDVECRCDEPVVCPLCQGPVALDNIKLPSGKRWSSCQHGQCRNCQKKDPADLKRELSEINY